MKRLIIIAGPTASGKTDLAIQVAKYLNTEIISCDSRQIFKEVSIGTAQPTQEELGRVKHHFVASHSIHDEYSAGDFEKDVICLLNELFQRYDNVVMVGGSGLYIRAVCNGLDSFPEVNPAVRDTLNKELQEFGVNRLFDELQAVDPIAAANIEGKNPQRVIRALEIFRETGKPISSFRKFEKVKRDFDIEQYVLDLPRELLYNRINQRVDFMMEAGLLDEVRSVFQFKHLNSLNTVGYKELFEYIEDETSLEEAVELIKRNTRRYAKRQLTWFRKDEEAVWIQPPFYENILKNI